MNTLTANSTPAASASNGAALARLSSQARSWLRRFNQRNQRERLVLIVACMALTWMAADRLWFGPALKEWQQGRTALSDARQKRDTLQADIRQRQADSANLVRTQQAELMQWRQRLKDADASLRSHEDSLVGADRMVDLLEKLLARHRDVQVLGLHSLGRSDLLNPAGNTAAAAPAALAASAMAAATAASPAPVVGLYRHGVELVLEGSYADLLSYMQAMEALPQRVLWGGASLKVEQHPRCVLTLRVYTLSRDPNWLEL
jgi:MSHA biogenesis protein MshJ